MWVSPKVVVTTPTPMQIQFKKTIINSIQKDKKGPRFHRRMASTRKWARSSCISFPREASYYFPENRSCTLYTPVHPDSRRTNSSCGLSAADCRGAGAFFIASPPAYPTTVTCGTPAMAHLSFPYKLVPWHSLIHRTHHLLLHL